MGIVQLPAPGVRGRGNERSALRDGVAVVIPVRSLRVLPKEVGAVAAYCSSCAGPIDFGAVVRGPHAYCSVECSLGGGDRPA